MTHNMDEQGLLCHRTLPDGRLVALMPLTFGNVMLTVGPGGDRYDGGFDDGYVYTDVRVAKVVWRLWDGESEPDGWIRHPASGRRRPDADGSREHVRR